MFEDFLPLLIPALYWIYRKSFSSKSYNDQMKEDLEKKENRNLEDIEKRETLTKEKEVSEERTPGIFENLFKEQREEQ